MQGRERLSFALQSMAQIPLRSWTTAQESTAQTLMGWSVLIHIASSQTHPIVPFVSSRPRPRHVPSNPSAFVISMQARKHWTSKIKDFEQLGRVTSFGFRGEVRACVQACACVKPL